MTTTIRRDYDPERDRREEALAEHEASREEERKAWARLVHCTALATDEFHCGQRLDSSQSAGQDEKDALDALRALGVDVGRYLAATDPAKPVAVKS